MIRRCSFMHLRSGIRVESLTKAMHFQFANQIILNYNNVAIFYINQNHLKKNQEMYNQNKMDNIKQSAYFDYFKLFSINAAQTIKKLQKTFKEQIADDAFLDSNHLFRKIKTLLSSYQILLMEIKDSCEFVQMPEFGVCIMRIFTQLMSVIKFMGKNIIMRSSNQRSIGQKRMDQRHTIISASPTEFYQYNLGSGNPQIKERQNFRIKEMATHIFNDISNQVMNMEKQQKVQAEESQKVFERINKGRQKLQEIQSSKSEAVLAETVNLLFKKSEHINNFLNIVQTNLSLQSKENCVETYLKIKQQFEQDCVPRFDLAKQKLGKVFQEHIKIYEKRRKQEMISKQCQVKIEDEQVNEQKSKTSFYSNKKSQNGNDQLKKLKSQLRLIEEENKTLKVFIQEKIQQYQNAITKLRSDKLCIENKSMVESKINFEKQKSSSIKKFQSYIQNIENTDNISQALSHISVQSESKDFYHTFDGGFSNKRSKINLTSNRMTRSKVKFQFDQKHLNLISQIICWTISTKQLDNSSKQQKLQKLTIEEMKFGKIEQQSSQNEYSFRESISQNNDKPPIKYSKGKKPKERTSLLVANQREQLLQSDNVCSKSKKNFHPFSSIYIKKHISNRKQFQDCISNHDCKDEEKNVQAYRNNQLKFRKNSPSDVSLAKLSNFFKSQKGSDKFCTSQEVSPHRSPASMDSDAAFDQNITTFNLQEHQIIFLEISISFQKEDLLNLFLNDANANNYELLNLNLTAKNNRFFSSVKSKKVIIKQMAKGSSQISQNNCSSSNLTPKYQAKQEDNPILNFLIDILYKYMKFLWQIKKEKGQKNYHILKNFIRFPHSSVHKKSQAEWKQYERQNSSLELIELKKYILRILKLHSSCKKLKACKQQGKEYVKFKTISICNHWRLFLEKIGIGFIKRNDY